MPIDSTRSRTRPAKPATDAPAPPAIERRVTSDPVPTPPASALNPLPEVPHLHDFAESQARSDLKPQPGLDEARLRLGVLSRVDTLSFDKVPVDKNGRIAPVQFELPPDAISFTVVVRGQESAAWLIDKVTGPDGKAIVNGGKDIRDVVYRALTSPNRSVIGMCAGVAVLLAPDNPKVEIKPGQWQIGACSSDQEGKPATGTADVQILIKRAARPPKKGRIDLNFCLTGTHRWTAKDITNDDDFNELLERTKALLKSAGIEVGAVKFEDAPNASRSIDLGGRGDRSPGALFKTTTKPGLNIFLVDEIQLAGMDGRGPVGFGGGIPGAPMPGTPASGIALSIDGNPDQPYNWGNALAHEIAHFLGLSHTIEAGGSLQDQLPDTEPRSYAAGNLMYWNPDGSPVSFSKQQADVMLRHPSVDIIE